VTDCLQARAATTPNAAAMFHDDSALTYANLHDTVSAYRTRLAGRGLQPGQRVALHLGDDALANALWIHAIIALGATLIPIGADLPESRVAELREQLGAEALVRAGPKASVQTFKPAPWRPKSPNSMLTILLTSGSSATPKAVPMSAAQHIASIRAITTRLNLTAADRWLCCLPFNHIGGLAILLRALVTGASVHLLDRFDPVVLAGTLESQPITRLSLVPTMLGKLLAAHPDRFVSRLTTVLIGGAPTPPQHLSEARARGLPVLPTWGMTEAGSQLATPHPDQAEAIDFGAHPGWVGPPLPGVAIRFTPDQIIEVRAPMLFSGYLDDDRAALDERGWFTTSDRGFIDAHGDLRLFGRADRVIISGGVNVSLDALEQRLRASGLIDDIALVAMPDPAWGQRIGAVYVARAEAGGRAGLESETLKSWCRAHLAPAERPACWRAVDRIPTSAVGKPILPDLKTILGHDGD